MKLSTIALGISSILLLSACGGSDSDNTSSTRSIQGKAIDGYKRCNCRFGFKL